jgi:hypothetical protein
MAKLIFSHASILQSDGSTAPAAGTELIYGLVSDGVEISLEPDTVNVEDNREIYESYTGRIVIRTVNTKFDADGNGDLILSSVHVSNDGDLPTVGTLKLHGKSGSHDIVTAPTYIQGHQSFDNGRLETVLIAQSADKTGNTTLVATDAS